MSEYAVEIEKMTVKLENLFMDSGNLSMNYFDPEGIEIADRVIARDPDLA